MASATNGVNGASRVATVTRLVQRVERRRRLAHASPPGFQKRRRERRTYQFEGLDEPLDAAARAGGVVGIEAVAGRADRRASCDSTTGRAGPVGHRGAGSPGSNPPASA